MKKHFTVSPKLSKRRRVTASTNTEDEILITEDFCSNLYDTLMEHCNCSRGDADLAINNLYHDYFDKSINEDVLVDELVDSLYYAAISDGTPPEELSDWRDTLWDTVPDAIDDALK